MVEIKNMVTDKKNAFYGLTSRRKIVVSECDDRSTEIIGIETKKKKSRKKSEESIQDLWNISLR